MEWIEVKITTTAEGIEPLTGALYDIGISGVVISDKEDFAEFLENNRKYWDYVDEELEKLKEAESAITFYLSNDEVGTQNLAMVKNKIAEMKSADKTGKFGALFISTANVKDEDWSENWKKYFHPLPLGEKVLIVPEWEQEDVQNPENRVVFTINPGMSFGTGSHESTQMCIEEIEKAVTGGERVLDLGCGSGILSVIALLLGAKTATAVDIDDKAVEVAFENLRRNNLKDSRMEGFAGDITSDTALREKIGNGFEIVVANIVADVIIAIAPYVRKFMTKNGTFICSGIINEREAEVEAALKNAGLLVENVRVRNEWSAIICK